QTRTDVAYAGETQGAGAHVTQRNRGRTATRSAHRLVHLLHLHSRIGKWVGRECRCASMTGPFGILTMADPVDHQRTEALPIGSHLPDIAAGRIAVERMLADTETQGQRRGVAGIQLHEHDRAPGIGEDVEQLRLTHQGTEPGALGAARGKSVRQALVEIEARAPIDADHFHGEGGACRNGAQMQRTMPRMLEQIRRQLRRHERHAAGIGLIETQLLRPAVRNPPGVTNPALLLDQPYQRRAAANIQDHLAMLMRVPAPGELSRSNPSTSRLAPVSPSPRPPPEVQPSVIASLISAIPGPSSRNVSRTPDLGPSANSTQSMSPPPP